MTTQPDVSLFNLAKQPNVSRKFSIPRTAISTINNVTAREVSSRNISSGDVSSTLKHFEKLLEERRNLRTDKFEYDRLGKEAGLVFIINQESFLDSFLESRKGSRRDVNEIIICFQRLGYNIVEENIVTDAKTEDVQELIKQIANRDFSNYNSLIFFYLSHGDEFNRLHTSNGTIATNEIWSPFEFSKGLQNKPKMFIFQACKGTGYSTTNIASPSTSSALVSSNTFTANFLYPDLLIAYSTIEGNISLRHTAQGSWFIQEICKNIFSYGRRDDVISLLIRTSKCVAHNYYHSEKKVDTQVDIKQMPLFISTLRKKFYLNTSKDRDLLLRVIQSNESILKELKDINGKLKDDKKKKNETKN